MYWGPLKKIFIRDLCNIKKGASYEMGKIIGTGLASVVNLLNPQKIIIGGGVADAGEILLDPIRKTILDRAMPIQAQAVEIVPAQLANTAGVIGASLLINS